MSIFPLRKSGITGRLQWAVRSAYAERGAARPSPEPRRHDDLDVRNTPGTGSPVYVAAQAATGIRNTDPPEFSMTEAAARPVVQLIARLQEDGGLKGTDIANFTGVPRPPFRAGAAAGSRRIRRLS